jgi:putative spermidine/putrescine transport system permease protein
LLWPLVDLARLSFADPWWQEYTDQLTSPAVRTILFRTLLLAVVATAVTLVIAYPAAYRIACSGARARKVVLGLLVLPYLTSFLVRTYAWIGLLGAKGPVTGFLRMVGFDIRSLFGTSIGVMVVLVHVFLPLMTFTIYVSMTKVDPAQLQAATSLGARPAEAFVRVYLPQTKPGVVAAIALVFTISAAMYATPALIGGSGETTLAVLIFDQISQLPPSQWSRPAALSGVLFLAVAIVMFLAARAVGAGALFGLGGNADRYDQRRRGAKAKPGWSTELVARAASRLPASLPGPRLSGLAVMAALLLVDAPLVFMIGVSLQPLRLLSFPTEGVSSRWYGEVLSDPEWLASARLSVFIALVATAVAVAVGAFLADRARRGPAVVRRTLTALALAPLLVPYIATA